MRLLFPAVLLLTVVAYGVHHIKNKKKPVIMSKDEPAVQVPPTHIGNIPLPAGYKRMPVNNSFAGWLGKMKLVTNTTLLQHDRQTVKYQHGHYAIFDVPYNFEPLQQCADAVMRLRAEYIFASKAQPAISFWHKPNQTFSINSSCTRKQLEAFLRNVFAWCGSYNLQQQLYKKSITSIAAGDVFVRGGSPGHAMIVVDVAVNKKGERVFLLAQSFMPAQNIHVVKNIKDKQLSPWYKTTGVIATPGYRFTAADLKSWEQE